MKKNAVKTVLAVMVALAACMAVLAGCAGGGTLSGEILSETGAFKVTADNASADSAASSGDAVTIGKGDVLLVSPDLTQGKLQVTLSDGSGNKAFDEEVSGRILDTYEIPEGTYDVTVTCKQAGTTGALVVHSVNADDFEQQDSDLEKALDSAGVKLADSK